MSTAQDPTELHRAVARGDLATVTHLLDGGVPVGARDANEWTPLHVAVACGQTEIVALLLARHADVTAKHNRGTVPLLLTCNKPLPRITELLLAAGADANSVDVEGDPALFLAAMFGQVGVMEVLLRGGAALGGVNARGRGALVAAADNGHAEAVRALLRHGAAVNAVDARGCTALHFAAAHGHLEAIAALLDGGADVNAADQNRGTPLHSAATCHPSVAALLLDRGADVNAGTDHDVTALHLAARAGLTTTARVLLDHGAEVEARNDQGGTPLFGASAHRRRDVVALLLAHGANLDAQSSEGVSARAAAGAAKGVGLGAVPLTPREPVAPPVDAAQAFDDFFAKRRRGYPLLRAFAAHDTWHRLVRAAAPDAPIVAPDGKRLTLLFSSDALVQTYRAHSPWLPADITAVTASGAAVFAALPANLDVLGIDHRPDDPPHSLHYGAAQLDMLRRVGNAVLLERAVAAEPLTMAVAAQAARFGGYVIARWTSTPSVDAIAVGPVQNRSPLIAVTTDDGRVLLPICTLDDAAAAFTAHTDLAWSGEGLGLGLADVAQISAKIFGLDQLPVDGAIINPHGPGPSRVLSLEECAWIVQAGAG